MTTYAYIMTAESTGQKVPVETLPQGLNWVTESYWPSYSNGITGKAENATWSAAELSATEVVFAPSRTVNPTRDGTAFGALEKRVGLTIIIKNAHGRWLSAIRWSADDAQLHYDYLTSPGGATRRRCYGGLGLLEDEATFVVFACHREAALAGEDVPHLPLPLPRL